MKFSIVILTLALGFGSLSEAHTVRATEVTADILQKNRANPADALVVEFHQGDIIPVNISAMGSLIQSTAPGSTSVTVQKNFWLMLQNNNVQMSLDGVTYKPIKDMVTGGISADASAANSGGAASIINVVFAAFLR